MSNAAIDINGRNTLTAVHNTDGSTVLRVEANPTNHGLEISDGTTGSDLGGQKAFIDENGRGSVFAVSKNDGDTPVTLYVDGNGKLLIQTT